MAMARVRSASERQLCVAAGTFRYFGRCHSGPGSGSGTFARSTVVRVAVLFGADWGAEQRGGGMIS